MHTLSLFSVSPECESIKTGYDTQNRLGRSHVCMNDHMLSFFIHKFTAGKEEVGCVRRQGNNADYETLILLQA